MGDARWLDEREAHAWRGVIGVLHRLTAVLDRQLVQDAGLSAAEYTLLVPLSEAPDGLLRARDLGRTVGWERSRISHQITRMEKRGLVVREECNEDARGSMVRLTAAGRAAITAAAPAHVAAVRQHFFSALTENELDVLGPALERVLARLPDNDG
ncbi:MarR family winged helix-turn-helix transcriptional regulator [Actinoalloteichus hymeniacidonis]|uniref:Transcriptional regulator n=1 Tax=Actinoalloteichus hymeniacidonis TaxID=340345 RepID=A0AAC9MXL6_9PSEU|nr:MarR family winged helix-turn-helix transcriptional regulator [Actinoalloteichus hymeniacidonis]AOS62370.1 transcriptional regulator [Actinoalloteichus hymeniacidonis]MBB5909602.1 DNA-binding MarR family transcriptional regulator [Actinoalloteichus hymeniacidonis]